MVVYQSSEVLQALKSDEEKGDLNCTFSQAFIPRFLIFFDHSVEAGNHFSVVRQYLNLSQGKVEISLGKFEVSPPPHFQAHHSSKIASATLIS